MEITPGWLASAACAVLGAGLLGLWSFQHADYADRSWWRVMADADAARAMRAWAGAALALFAFGVWRLFASAATPPVVGEADPDVRAGPRHPGKAEVAEPGSNLALLGDKRFLFSASGESFLMFGVRGRTWIALGAPVGPAIERLELLWRFRELADSHAARPGVYGLGADDLPEIVELGFSIQKVGESAAVPLETFTLEGRRRGNLRRAWRKAGEEGASFQVLQGEDAAADAARPAGDLRRVARPPRRRREGLLHGRLPARLRRRVPGGGGLASAAGRWPSPPSGPRPLAAPSPWT